MSAVAPVTERPILFSAPMIQALLAGRKTQTRRVVKPAPDWERPEPCCSTTSEGWQGPVDRSTWADCADPEMDFRRCPYGAPGDRRWVRETFSGPWSNRLFKPSDWAEDAPIWYWADGDPSEGDWTRPKPSIHMPRWASRLTLEVTEVRVERLASISREDAIAEGAISRPNKLGLGSAHDGWSMDWSRIGRPAYDGRPLTERDIQLGSPESAFANFINELHGGQNWNFHYNGDLRYPQPLFDANPWVWAVSFDVFSPTPSLAAVAL